MTTKLARIQYTAISMCAALMVLPLAAAQTPRPTIEVRATKDFTITGDGSNEAWNATGWVKLQKRPDGQHPYEARFKALYSATGIYFLFDGTDSKLTATIQEDFEDLWEEDVYEVFLWTDVRYPVYFEYEISPLNKELPILIPNFGGQFLGWRPWHYEGERRTRKAVAVRGGEQKSHASIQGWSAEVFFPYGLFQPLQNVPPKPGTQWRANVYRVDHDHGNKTAWDWARVGESFHEYQKFGTFTFK